MLMLGQMSQEFQHQIEKTGRPLLNYTIRNTRKMYLGIENLVVSRQQILGCILMPLVQCKKELFNRISYARVHC